MHAVILAAGKGTRMKELVKDKPKPMLEVAGKTLLEHKLDALPDDVTDIVLIVNYLADVIKEKYGDAYGGKKITYVHQENSVGGTADALWCARSELKGKFLVLMGDDLYSREDIQAVRGFDWAVMVQHVDETLGGGKVILDADKHVIDIIESGHHDGGKGAVCTNLFSLDSRLFDYPQMPKAPDSKELGLPQTVLAASKASGIPFNVVEATHWIQITSPDDLKKAERLLKK